MESVLVIFCIVFFVILTIGLVKSSHLHKFHKEDCHVIYIPKEYDLEQAFKMVSELSIDGLKKKARLLGASKEFVDSSKPSEIKLFIVQNIISNEHILFTDLNESINDHTTIKKREYCRERIRQNKPDPNYPTNPKSLSDYKDILLPEPTKIFEYPNISTKEILKEMKVDIDDYQNKNIIYDI